MQQSIIKDRAIVLKRVDYGEADRIVTLLTRANGRIELIAKGCRKAGSKLAGGIEPFSANEIAWIQSRNGKSLHTLRSARSDKVYTNILKDYDILKIAYDMLAIAEKTTRHNVEGQTFEVVEEMFNQIDNEIDIMAIEVWFILQILYLNGHQPDLSKDVEDNPLIETAKYIFDTEEGSMRKSTNGVITADHIKALRVLQAKTPSVALQIAGLQELVPDLLISVRSIYNYHLQ